MFAANASPRSWRQPTRSFLAQVQRTDWTKLLNRSRTDNGVSFSDQQEDYYVLRYWSGVPRRGLPGCCLCHYGLEQLQAARPGFCMEKPKGGQGRGVAWVAARIACVNPAEKPGPEVMNTRPAIWLQIRGRGIGSNIIGTAPGPVCPRIFTDLFDCSSCGIFDCDAVFLFLFSLLNLTAT